MTESVFTVLKDLFEAIVANQARSGVIAPHKFLEVLRKENEMFRSSMHQDAHEFLNMLLNAVVDTVEAEQRKLDRGSESQANGYPPNGLVEKALTSIGGQAATGKNLRWVHELFEGTLTSETKCLTCENVSQRDEPFLDLL